MNGAKRSQAGAKVTTAGSGAAGPAEVAGDVGSSAAGATRSSSVRSSRARSAGSPSRSRLSSSRVEAVPVPIRIVVRPSTRWIGEAVRSTVRTRSSGVDRTCG